MKWFLMRTEIAERPLGPVTVRRFLRSARRIARGSRPRSIALAPDVVVLLNGLFLFEAVGLGALPRRGIDVVTYERG